MTRIDLRDVRRALADTLNQDTPPGDVARAKRRVLLAAIVCEAFRRRGLAATLVGGGAIEFYAPGAYATDDTDLIVEGPRCDSVRSEVELVFQDMGFCKRGRHWVRDEMFVEVPGTSMDEPVEEYAVAGYKLRVVKPEVVLADRIVGYKHWGYTAYGLQTIAMLAAFGSEIDETWLRNRLEREDAVDAYEALRRLEAASHPITDAQLRAVLDNLKSGTKHDADSASEEEKR